ncbi:uncharacterized protein LOC131803271 [Musca domestica]|uniref:Uncharacterized protein LOC131803270 n=1 Tax=Musca domestica TaxID=7370 RepID=A0ABM3V3I5_MUSDO|nr:uncharacterized protein LOC131803270 [Musca domestica]XP_058980343.1 uncharacterized protein LOC131803271 [Musca domestica]
MASQQELFPEVCLSDYDEEMMSDREVEAELRANKEAFTATVPQTADTTQTPKPIDPQVQPTQPIDPQMIAPPNAETTLASQPQTALEPKVSSAPSRMASSSSRALFQCRLCSHHHPLHKCFVFRKMTVEKRVRMVVRHRYCYNCLRLDHVSKFCPVPKRCNYCGKKHHTILHEHQEDSSNRTQNSARWLVPRGIVPTPPPHILPTSVLPISRVFSLSPTLRVNICLPNSTVPVRALLDPCCPVSQVCASLINDLRWPTTKVNHMSYADFMITSRFDPGQRQFVTASVANITCGVTPPMTISSSVREAFVGLELADPSFDCSGPVAMVLGPEIYYKIIKPRIIQQPGLPTAQYTSFGWVISGPVNM